MIYRNFQNIKLSGLGLGMMRLPTLNGNDSAIDEQIAEEMIDIAYKSGINYFDTAWGYHGGHSEEIAGKYLSKYHRESYYLATKFPGYDNSNMPKIEEIFEKQLEKCRTKYFDFYLFHNVYEGNVDDYLNAKYGIIDYLLKQKSEGRIKYLGFSCHGSIDVLKKFLRTYGKYMEFCQIQLNYMDWHFQKCEQKVKLLNKFDIPIFVMEPLRGGKLAAVSDEIAQLMNLRRPYETVPGWAFRFIQAITGVKVVLSGMSSIQQLKDNINTWATDKPLDASEISMLTEQADKEAKSVGVPCTSCRYCINDCPQKLPIPLLLSYYNEFVLTGGGFIAPMGIASLEKEKRPSNCISCCNCEKLCPQQIKISEVLHEFSKKLGM